MKFKSEIFHFMYNDSRIYESWTFWIKLRKKNELFHDVQIFRDAPVYMIGVVVVGTDWSTHSFIFSRSGLLVVGSKAFPRNTGCWIYPGWDASSPQDKHLHTFGQFRLALLIKMKVNLSLNSAKTKRNAEVYKNAGTFCIDIPNP